MAITETSKTTEFSTGVSGSLAMHSDSSTGYLYSPAVLVPSETGGLSINSFSNAASNNATVVKSSAGMLYGFTIGGISPEVNYIKFYDTASAPTPGTTTIKLRYCIPKAATATDGQSIHYFFPQGITFSTGIAFAMIESIADAGTTAMDTADELLVTIYYK